MKRKSRIILWSLLLSCITTFCIAQTQLSPTLLSGKDRIVYNTTQDSIHVSWSNGGKPGVFVPEYTFRKTVYLLRKAQTCSNTNLQLLKQITQYEKELTLQKQRMVYRTDTLNIVTITKQKAEDRFKLQMEHLRSDTEITARKEKAIADGRILSLTNTVTKYRKRTVGGFIIGFGVGVISMVVYSVAK